MKCFITSCTRKTTDWYFKRCGLKKCGKTRADIAQLPVAHARTLPREISSGSHPVAMSVMRNGTFCTTTIVRKKARKPVAHAHAITSVMSLPGPHPVAPPGSTPWNATLSVLIYYFRLSFTVHILIFSEITFYTDYQPLKKWCMKGPPQNISFYPESRWFCCSWNVLYILAHTF
jgi:hypothetical protein